MAISFLYCIICMYLYTYIKSVILSLIFSLVTGTVKPVLRGHLWYKEKVT